MRDKFPVSLEMHARFHEILALCIPPNDVCEVDFDWNGTHQVLGITVFVGGWKDDSADKNSTNRRKWDIRFADRSKPVLTELDKCIAELRALILSDNPKP